MKRVDVPDDILTDCTEKDRLVLPDDTSHYIGNVLRKSPGDRLELFDGARNAVVVQVVSVDDRVSVQIEKRLPIDRNESPIATTLYQAIPKGKRWKWLLQKATELGVDQIVPLETRHTVVQIPDDRLPGRLERWDKIVSSAARQCQRAKTPAVPKPRKVQQALADSDEDLQLVAHNGVSSSTIAEYFAANDQAVDSVGLWIGPEGGFHDDEIEAMTELGAAPVSLGPRILRSETAGIATLTLIQSIIGDL